jgi:hypothetical protein
MHNSLVMGFPWLFWGLSMPLLDGFCQQMFTALFEADVEGPGGS